MSRVWLCASAAILCFTRPILDYCFFLCGALLRTVGTCASGSLLQVCQTNKREAGWLSLDSVPCAFNTQQYSNQLEYTMFVCNANRFGLPV